ncbi:MAG: hypothetical protein JO011_01160 [Ktedonobacteraceae bacterium]|nr:hypothetical protein [Ktedonobacteraceae bacterium]
MPVLVHLTPAKNVKRIRRSGIHKGEIGVYCLPVVQNYYVSHQWLRELKRWGQRTFIGIYFRVPDEEMVWFGHYGQPHQHLPVTEAIRLLMQAQDPQGYELILPRSISAKEIYKVQFIPHVVGWRYMPGAHERVWCGCPVCVSRGEIKSRKKRLRYHRSLYGNDQEDKR